MSVTSERNEGPARLGADSLPVLGDLEALLVRRDARLTLVSLKAQQALFVQGDAADAIFCIRDGRAKLTMVSKSGKEATITLLAKGDLVGEEALAEASGLRVASATTLTECAVLRIEGREMRRVMRGEPKLADLLLAQLLARIVRAQADLADQLFNSSEKRLARALLLMAEGVEGDVSKMQLPQVTQGTLADMIGTTRSRVSFFMNRFRERGFIEYDRRIRVNKSLLNRVLSE